MNEPSVVTLFVDGWGVAWSERTIGRPVHETNDAREDADDPLTWPIDRLDVRSPARSALKKAGVKTVRDLTRRTVREVIGLKNVGITGLRQIEKALREMGLSFARDDFLAVDDGRPPKIGRTDDILWYP